MITYHYRCEAEGCAFEYEIRQSIKDEPISLCPECNQNTAQRVIHCGGDFIIKEEPKTLGVLADRNNKKMGKFEKEDKTREIKQKGKKGRKYLGKLKEGATQQERPDPNYKPWWRKEAVDKGLAKLTPKEKHTYILTGKKPSNERKRHNED